MPPFSQTEPNHPPTRPPDSTNEQRFYTGHTDDILCLTHHPEQDLVATGQIGKKPTIHVWHMDTLETKSILQGFHSRGVCAIDFHPDGKHLASVGLDNDHSICLWDWRKGTQLATTRGHKDKIFEIRFNPVAEAEVGQGGPCVVHGRERDVPSVSPGQGHQGPVPLGQGHACPCHSS